MTTREATYRWGTLVVSVALLGRRIALLRITATVTARMAIGQPKSFADAVCLHCDGRQDDGHIRLLRILRLLVAVITLVRHGDDSWVAEEVLGYVISSGAQT